MNQKPLISVIMNCFNGQDYLNEALKSILNQFYLPTEILIMLDGPINARQALGLE